MKKEIVIITDIWGMNNSSWIDHYVSSLANKYEVNIYDSQVLASIDSSNLNEKAIHELFLNGGIDKAIEYLIKKNSSIFAIIGFSIGGLIAWKACLTGLNVGSLIAISSTRLRYEIEKPNCNLLLIYGQEDIFKPEEKWMKSLDVNCEMVSSQGHEMYKNIDIIPDILQKIKQIL